MRVSQKFQNSKKLEVISCDIKIQKSKNLSNIRNSAKRTFRFASTRITIACPKGENATYANVVAYFSNVAYGPNIILWTPSYTLRTMIQSNKAWRLLHKL